MSKYLVKFTRRWLLLWEEETYGFSGVKFWRRNTKLYWSEGLVTRRATILNLSPWSRNVQVIDTHATSKEVVTNG